MFGACGQGRALRQRPAAPCITPQRPASDARDTQRPTARDRKIQPSRKQEFDKTLQRFAIDPTTRNSATRHRPTALKRNGVAGCST
jgi:hypothetical protein